MSGGDWLVCPHPNPHARVRLLGFPHCGGGTGLFRSWSAALPDVEVTAVLLPGRERRLDEPPFSAMAPLVSAAADALEGWLAAARTPIVCFGHSMGALVAFELAREWRRRGVRQPATLLVSAAAAPPVDRSQALLHRRDDRALLEAVADAYGGLERTVIDHPELQATYGGLLRADFAVCETYRYAREAPLDCRIVAFGGREDKVVPSADLEAWRFETTARFALTVLRGGHFYLQTEEERFLQLLARELEAV